MPLRDHDRREAVRFRPTVVDACPSPVLRSRTRQAVRVIGRSGTKLNFAVWYPFRWRPRSAPTPDTSLQTCRPTSRRRRSRSVPADSACNEPGASVIDISRTNDAGRDAEAAPHRQLTSDAGPWHYSSATPPSTAWSYAGVKRPRGSLRCDSDRAVTVRRQALPQASGVRRRSLMPELRS